MTSSPMTQVGPTATTEAVPRVLSIAGTDPTGGAGIQADLKSISANGGYAMAVVTSLVAQNTSGVRGIHTPPVDFLTEQLTAVSDDVTIDAVKIGMLGEVAIIDAVGTWLRANRPPLVVIDPVMVAASGDHLLAEAAEAALIDFVGVADLITPNIPELAVLAGEPAATTVDKAVDQARQVAARHDVLVLMKGGHLDGDEAVDALVSAGGVVASYSTPRIATNNTHGTGCSLSSAIATLKARKLEAQQTGGRHDDWAAVVARAKDWLTESIAAADSLDVGRGNGPVSHFAGLWRRGGHLTWTAASVESLWWEGIADTRAAIDELDFVRQLGEGSLAAEPFTWYLAQDALYLRDYSRALAAASTLAPTPAEQAFWAGSAHQSIVTELELHAGWLPNEGVCDATASATTTAYVDHLLAAATRGDYGELIAALLPCFWVYVDVGSRLVHLATDDHPYAAWLRTYSDADFEASTRQAIDIVTAHAAAADEATRRRMRAAFDVSARHELDFFAAPLRR